VSVLHSRSDRIFAERSCGRGRLLAIMERPQTRYVDVGGADVGYQIVGEGPPDLVYVTGFGHVDVRWEDPLSAAFLERLASFSRLIMFDRRGTGVSDAVPDSAIPTWEGWADDVRAVLDASGSERVVVFAEFDGGPTGLLFASMHPERVSGLILANATARTLWDDDYPIGIPSEVIDGRLDVYKAAWGTLDMAQISQPSRADDAEFGKFAARFGRAAATPRSAIAQARYMIEHLDARDALPLIRVPTLVLHTKDNLIYPIEFGLYLADHIEGAKFVELPGADCYLIASVTGIEAIGEIGEFVTGERPQIEVDRILTTLLFTDIVGSTERAASLGDSAWRSLLDTHDRAVRDQLHRFRGREIETTGDGFLAAFDGPARAIRCALSIAEAIRAQGMDLHLGLHTGECEVRGDGLAGLTVHIAARICAAAGPGEVLVSSTVRDLVAGSGIEFSDRREHELKGVPGTWTLFSVEG
jgi:class 3 adenylate cyclase/alpha-beta hydrolase superfamily lysophospholipase